ncbi:Hypothetical protein FF011L_20620 [Roseimaritima multifibrata]|uniref:Ribonuclease HIII n=1 Tax=Roseimaritima multifibrata TaxID=1930274 RepID=A0A517MEI4_9BACT|nr:hypothetical protein [Roseimaritima multifibrata]QDS93300.1 Hypothetical protein FF011L_20620 [Roseimaritima multifibrata]
MLLIATDEAGYGPKLGPLVIAATVWRLPDSKPMQAIEALSEKVVLPGLPAISVADSKTVFKPRQKQGLLGLETTMNAAVQWAFPKKKRKSFYDWLAMSAPADVRPLTDQPWFAKTDLQKAPFLTCSRLQDCQEFAAEELRRVWQAKGAELVSVVQRVIDAKRFNLACQQATNKAQVLSELTNGMVAQVIAEQTDEKIAVYCDRHGGRAYYGPLLKQAIPESSVTIESETKNESRYRLEVGKQQIEWRFTVKGDSFPPVSFASMLAKYTRERSMECFNRYWGAETVSALKPTAGYPQDAVRFLEEIETDREERQIPVEMLVRSR